MSTCFDMVLCGWREGERAFKVPVDSSQQAWFFRPSRRTDGKFEEVLTDNAGKVSFHNYVGL